MVKAKNKHICVIVSCILAVMVAIMPLLSLNNNKQTAKADSITGWEPVVLIPSFSLVDTGHSTYTYTIPSLFLARIEGNQFRFYYPSSTYGTDGHYSSVVVDRNGQPVKFPFHGQRFNSETNSYIYYELFNKQADGTPNTYVEFKLGSVNLWYDVFTLSVKTEYSEANYGSSVSISFNGKDGSEVGSLFIAYCKPLSVVNGTNYFNFTTVSNNISESDMNKYLYNSGYQTGYNSGYQSGYNKGVSTTWKDLSPFQTLVNGVNDFLDARIFGTVSFRLLFMCGMGVLLVLLLFRLVR